MMRLTAVFQILLAIHVIAFSAMAQQSPPPKQTADSSSAITNSAIELKTATGTLFGTLDLPTTDGPWPIAVIIAGSGPTDRDGNQAAFKNNSLKFLGQALAAHGIAALRYDKRGVGQSNAAGQREQELRFETFVDDAVAWIALLRQDLRFTHIAVIGHSEGSLVGILAAKQAAKVEAFVSLDGAGRNIADVLREQLKNNLPTRYEQSDHILRELAAGHTVDKIPSELADLFRPSAQPYLISWLKYEPTREIAALDVPILIVQGSTDLQASQNDAQLLADANKNARLALVPNMDHVLKHNIFTWKLVQLIDYTSPSPLEPQLIEQLVPFLDEALSAQKK
jgi:pimeloyl-ACP methyl ester carboxylesterase